MWDWDSYILYFFVATISYIILNRYDNKKGNNYLFLILGLLPIFLMMALRGRDVGIDLVRYEVSIMMTGKLEYTDLFSFLSEPLFLIIYRISNILGGLHPFIIITSLLQFIFILIACKNFHENGYRIAFIVILFWGLISIRSFSMVRNGIAIACSLCAYTSFLKKNYNRSFWLFTLLAIGFHNSAIINIPIYFICRPFNYYLNNKIKQKIFIRSLILFGTATILFVAAKLHLMELMEITQSVREGRYLGFELDDQLGIGNFLIRLPFLVLSFMCFNSLRKENGYEFLPFLMLLILDLVVSQMKYISQNFERFTMYTQLSEIVLLGMLVQTYLHRYGKILLLIAYIFGMLYSTYYLHHWAIYGGDGDGLGTMPYNVWEK